MMVSWIPIMKSAWDMESQLGTGELWFKVGPGIFRSCKRIDWFLGHPAKPESDPEAAKVKRLGGVLLDLTRMNKITVKAPSEKFDKILSWVKTHFYKRLNFTPKEPNWHSVVPSDGTLILYDAPEIDDSKWSLIPRVSNDIRTSEKECKDALLIIPVCPDTLGDNDNERSQRLAELKALFNDKP